MSATGVSAESPSFHNPPIFGGKTVKSYQRVARQLVVIERAALWNPRIRRIFKAAPLVVMFLLLNSRMAGAQCSFSPSPDPTTDGSSNSLRAICCGIGEA